MTKCEQCGKMVEALPIHTCPPVGKSDVDALVMDAQKTKAMAAAPRDGTVILAWHHVHSCWLPIKWHKVSNETMNWLEATITTWWPEESFTCWMDHPPAP